MDLEAIGRSTKDWADNIDGESNRLNAIFDLIKFGIDALSRLNVENGLYAFLQPYAWIGAVGSWALGRWLGAHLK